MVSLFPPSGPSLPPFRSLLISGPYHPSAPVHLLLSFIRREATTRAILLSPSRSSLRAALVDQNEDWLNTQGSHGSVFSCASRCEILYPPSPAHLVALLSMLHEYNGTYHHPKTTLPAAPSLLVLHEVSALLTESSTVSTYLTLITHAMSAVRSWAAQSSTPILLAVFDTALLDLRLPIIRIPNHEMNPLEAANTASERTESVLFLAEKYFDWSGRAEEEKNLSSSLPEASSSIIPRLQRQLSMRRPRYRDHAEITWKWAEERREVKDTIFLFS
ncbi:hypothetical protein CERSUDRAFT_111242 [Gelatoporia subvermispora B]|uniref:Uncharacterized protein n=1 Tax=Ceriporiopsis subvermispora (strain B) TaxID=914234 RepID=M2RQD6_CERS8|nr:hypothetical protein CERSUDRAFT_111242 [Gelatoporia subvermispora B]